MGEKLIKCYQFVGEKIGIEGRIKLAHITKIPSNLAALEPDSPENLETFKKAVVEITGELPKL